MNAPDPSLPAERNPWHIGGKGQWTLLGAVVCITLLTWTFISSSAVPPESHAEYTRRLRDLREIDTLVDGELLANRLELVRNYDALTERIGQAESIVRTIQDPPAFLDPAARDAISQEAADLARTVARKAELIDRFKRNNAVLRNSQAYFPVAADELLESPALALPLALRQHTEQYVRAMLAFTRTPSTEGSLHVAAHLQQLRAQPQSQAAREAVNNLLIHGEQITQHLLDLDRLTQEIVALGSRQQMEKLFVDYARGHDRASARAARYRSLLYAEAILLAAFLAGIFLRLERTRQSLTRAHGELSARYAAQLAVEKQLTLHATAFRSAHDGIILTDADGVILDVNPAFTRITGWERDEVIARSPRMFKSGRHDAAFYQAMWQSIRETGSWRGEIWNRNKFGDIYPELLSISAVRNADDKLSNYVAVFADIRRIKAQEQQLTQLAYYDALTELPNRVLLADRLGQGIAQARRTGTSIAICYLDLDGFKPINDTWGHLTGDKVLVEIARRLHGALRGGDTVARLGGDEFVLLLQDIDGQAEAHEAALRILQLIATPLTQVPGNTSITASMGITLFPNDDADPDTLLRHADQAMYHAKEAGKNSCRLFDTEQDKFKRSRQDRYLRIEQALENQEFRLHFQPKVDLRQGTVIGAEALIRWQHPERGLLPPVDFLPLIEDDDLIKLIGDWVIESALQQMEAWQAAGFSIPVSVNIAARQLQAPEFIEKLKASLYLHPEVAHHLELEILETAALEDVVKSSRVIDECRMLGIRFALDDFGTGYSSLTYLKRLPAETIKIDQSFVRELLNDSHNLVIVRSVIGLARSFQREVIAEGVETVEHGRFLIQLGCDRAQGYGIARPMPGDAFVDWAKHWQVPAEWRAISDIKWDETVYPLLIAEVAHRSWVDQLAFALEHDQPPPHRRLHDYRQCQLSQWLANEGAAFFMRLPAFQAIDGPHRRMHRIAETIDTCWREGKTGEARALLPGLLASRDEVLAILHQLQIESSAQPLAHP
ncbi:MAG TPA: EAL domain-containing protein [Azonexus sp.]|nr:EAL domain-containing protein [Azonexus sp.]